MAQVKNFLNFLLKFWVRWWYVGEKSLEWPFVIRDMFSHIGKWFLIFFCMTMLLCKIEEKNVQFSSWELCMSAQKIDHTHWILWTIWLLVIRSTVYIIRQTYIEYIQYPFQAEFVLYLLFFVRASMIYVSISVWYM